MKAKLNDIHPVEWRFNFKAGVAWFTCEDKGTANDIISELKENQIRATLQTHAKTKKPIV